MTHEDILKQAKDALDKAIEQKKSNEMLLKSIGPAVIDALKPVLNQIKEAVSAIRVDVKPNIEVNPKVDMPRIPAPEVTVNVPDFPKIPAPIVHVDAPIVKVPDLQWPKDKMPIEGWVQLMGVSLDNPLPVQIRDAKGRPIDFSGNITQILGGGGGGKTDFFTIKGFSQSAFADYLNADGRLRVSVETGGSGLTDNELRAAHLDVQQVSGAIDSVYVKGFDASVSATILNGDGASLDPRDRNWTITETVTVSGALDTVKASGIARQSNPTAVSDGDNARFVTDDLGRQLVRPHQVRDLIKTARATLTTGTETTLISAVAGAYLDCMSVMCANNSDVAVSVDLRAVTGGNVVQTIQVPAGGTAGWVPSTPWPQDETGNNWTADMPDITGTTVTISALFSKEV